MKRLLPMLLVLNLAACTMSRAPITALTPQPVDERLLGSWRVTVSDDDLNPELLEVSKLADGKLLVSSKSTDAGDHVTPERMEVTLAEFDGLSYASIEPNEQSTDPPRWMVCRFEIESPDRIQIYLANLDLLDDAVGRKLIAGRKHEDSRHFDMFELEADTAGLRAFVIAHGARVFSLKGPVLERTGKTAASD